MKKKLFAILLSSTLCSTYSALAMEKEDLDQTGIVTTVKLTANQIQDIKNEIKKKEKELQDLRKDWHCPPILPENDLQAGIHNAWVLSGAKEYEKIGNALLRSIKEKKAQIYTSLPDEQKYSVKFSKLMDQINSLAGDEYVIHGFLPLNFSHHEDYELKVEALERALETTKNIKTQAYVEHLILQIQQKRQELKKTRTALESLKEAMEDETIEKTREELTQAIKQDRSTIKDWLVWGSKIMPEEMIPLANSWLKMDLLTEDIKDTEEQALQKKEHEDMMTKLYKINHDLYEAQEEWKAERAAGGLSFED